MALKERRKDSLTPFQPCENPARRRPLASQGESFPASNHLGVWISDGVFKCRFSVTIIKYLQQIQIEREACLFVFDLCSYKDTVYHSGEDKVAGRADKVWWEEQQAAWSYRICVQEAESELEDLLGYKASKLFPVTHFIQQGLLKVPQLSQAVPPAGNQVFKHMSLWGTSHS